MADAFTPVLNLTKPEVNQSAETWGTKMNANMNALDAHAGTVNGQIAGVPAQIQAALTAMFPRGAIILWFGNINAPPAGWAVCNGSNGTPALYDRFVLATAPGGRAVGETGGGFTSPNAVTDVQGWHSHAGVTANHVLTQGQMPYHQHGGGTDVQGWHAHVDNTANEGYGAEGYQQLVPGGGHGPKIQAASTGTGGAGNHSHNITTDFRGNNEGHYHVVYADGNHQHNVTVSTVPPYYCLAYIMRL